MDIRGRCYNIGIMCYRRTDASRGRWLALALCPLWLGTLTAPSAAEEPPARLRVPGVDAACRVDAEQRARSEMRLQAVEWLADPAKQAGPPSSARSITRVEIAGRARSAAGWVRLTANCTYANGRLPAISVRTQPAPALDLSGVAPLPTPPAPLDALTAQMPSLDGSAADPSPSVRLTPSLRETPFDPLTTNARRQDFLGSHQFAIKLQTPF
jgi:hypothetical protein